MEVGSNLVNAVSGSSSSKGGKDSGAGQANLPEPVKLVGGIGMEILRVRLAP